MISALNIQKRFGDRIVLRDLKLEIAPGSVTLLVGANGAGKTTLMRILTGLSAPDEGTVIIDGVNLALDRQEALSRLAFLPQAPRFHARLTVAQVARYYAKLRGIAEADVEAGLLQWGLADHLAMPTSQLSGGLRQRLAIAVFAQAHASVLLLDEPGLSLDPEWRHKLQLHLAAEAARGATVLVATHLLGEWENKTDACVLLECGKVGSWIDPSRLREIFNVVPRLPVQP